MDKRKKPTSKLCWRAQPATRRLLFAAPPVDLLTLVIAEEIRRKAQAERQREASRDALYEIAPSFEYDREHGTAHDSTTIPRDRQFQLNRLRRTHATNAVFDSGFQ
jgi:hypothetical protein